MNGKIKKIVVFFAFVSIVMTLWNLTSIAFAMELMKMSLL